MAVLIVATAMLWTLGVSSPVQSAPARTMHVSPSGADDQPGSKSQPWKTLRRALAALQPGDTLRVDGGTYTERVVGIALQQGQPSAPIRVEADRGERAIVKGLLELKRPSYWIFDGINVTWDSKTGSSEEHMVKLIDGVGWTFKNAEVWGAHSYAAVLIVGTMPGEPSNWTFSDNCVHDTSKTHSPNQDQLLYVNTGLEAGPGLIEKNLLFGAANGMGVKLGGPSPTVGGATGVEVRFNSIYETSQGILVAWGSRDNLIRRNIIYGSGRGYGNIRSFELTGKGNVVSENAGGGADSLLQEDPGYGSLVNGPDNRFPVNPEFDSVSECNGFRPREAVAMSYGRYAAPSAEPAEERARDRRPWTGPIAAKALIAGAGVVVAGFGLSVLGRLLRHRRSG